MERIVSESPAMGQRERVEIGHANGAFTAYTGTPEKDSASTKEAEQVRLVQPKHYQYVLLFNALYSRDFNLEVYNSSMLDFKSTVYNKYIALLFKI